MNSSCPACQWRMEDSAPGSSRVRFTPKFFRPAASPTRLRWRPATRLLYGSGYPVALCSGTSFGSKAGVLSLLMSVSCKDAHDCHAHGDAKGDLRQDHRVRAVGD